MTLPKIVSRDEWPTARKEQGPVGLLDLFDGQRQLVVQHFMSDPEWEDGCDSCTAAVDELSDGLLRHLRARSTTYAVIARAPLARLDAPA